MNEEAAIIEYGTYTDPNTQAKKLLVTLITTCGNKIYTVIPNVYDYLTMLNNMKLLKGWE